MKVVHLSAFDLAGGAARAAYRIHSSLRRAGVDSTMLVLKKRGEDTHVVPFQPSGTLLWRLLRRLRRGNHARVMGPYKKSRPKGLEPFTLPHSEFGSTLLAQLPEFDVLHLHWVTGMFDYQRFLAGVPSRCAIVWTLHDMNPFTGGCHYALGCSGYTSQCGRCPQLGSTDLVDLAAENWLYKRQAYSSLSVSRVALVSPSQWLAREIRRSSLLRSYNVSCIPYGVDTEVFSPRDQAVARDVLGLPRDAAVVLFVAQSLNNTRKGMHLLAEALNQSRFDRPVYLLSAGSETFSGSIKIPAIHLGTIHHDRILSLVYSAADLTIVPSLEDNFPNTILESQACGTPVLGFETSGIAEMIRTGRSGWLVHDNSIQGLSRAITEQMGKPSMAREMRGACRRWALEHYSLTQQSTRYNSLYANVGKKFCSESITESQPAV